MAVCGLIVAISAGVGVVAIAGMKVTLPAYQSASATHDLVVVPVAVKDIPVGIKITTDNFKDYFVWKGFPSDAVPLDTLFDFDDLIGKRTKRALHIGEVVTKADVHTFIDPPPGTTAVNVQVRPNAYTAGFALPGYKVVLVATKRSEKQQKNLVLPVLVDVLILAVDSVDPQTEEMVLSLAVTDDQSELLEAAMDGGASFQIQLPGCSGWVAHETDDRVARALPRSADDVRAFLAGN